MTLLSDSSDTETDNEEEEMIAELNHLQKSVDLGGIIKNLFSYLPVIGHALAITARGFFHTRTHPTARVLGVRVSRAHTFRTRRDRTLPLQVFFREKHQNDPKCYPNGFLTRKKNFVFGIFGVVEFFSWTNVNWVQLSMKWVEPVASR